MCDQAPPPKVKNLAQMACQNVLQVMGVEPDFTPETMPLVDQYLRMIPGDAPRQVQDLAAASAGCYFGEVMRRLLNGRWALAGPSPDRWRVEMLHCFLYFYPMGMAGEVIVGGPDQDYDGSFATLDGLQQGLSAALAAAPPFPEEEYYSLSGRIDVLQLATELLVGQELAAEDPHGPYSAEDYQRLLDDPLPFNR